MTKRTNNLEKSEWRKQHPITIDAGIQHKNLDVFIPQSVKNVAHNVIGSPNQNLKRAQNDQLGEQNEKKEYDPLAERMSDLARDEFEKANSRKASHGNDSGQGASSNNEISNEINPQENTQLQPQENTQPPLSGGENDTNVSKPMRSEREQVKYDASPPAQLADAAFNLENLNAYLSLHIPNPLLDLNINVKSTLNGAHKQATVDIAWNIEQFKNLPIPEIVQAASRVARFHFSGNTYHLKPYISFSTTGHKVIGIKTTGVREVHSSVNDGDDLNQKSIPEISSQSLQSSIIDKASVNKNAVDESHLDDTQSSIIDKASVNKNAVDKSHLDDTQSSIINKASVNPPGFNQRSFLVAESPLLKDITFYKIAEKLFNSAAEALKQKQGAYFCVGLILINVRIVVLRVRKNKKSKNTSMSEQEFIEKTKILTFVIDRSTDLSALAFSLVCLPPASDLFQSGFDIFLLFLKFLSNYVPENFFDLFLCFLQAIPLFSEFSSLIKYSIIFCICCFFRTIIINGLEAIVNFFVEQLCALFVSAHSTVHNWRNANA